MRARHNRNLAKTGEEEAAQKLWDKASQQQPLGQIEFMLEANGDRKVCQSLYALRATLPKHKGEPELDVTAILAREDNPPPGEKAIEWRLLTNREAATLEQAAELVGWYRCRWPVDVCPLG
ncbi:hypothetical protein [Methylovulum miyakonense]|uniref:hypothetical protein n=1 Tax=Methylovulum miyakonense TaxID=645578 RepID=UPI00048DF9F4|nr:hypothetical protein [Methylovulum miyakonense]